MHKKFNGFTQSVDKPVEYSTYKLLFVFHSRHCLNLNFVHWCISFVFNRSFITSCAHRLTQLILRCLSLKTAFISTLSTHPTITTTIYIRKGELTT